MFKLRTIALLAITTGIILGFSSCLVGLRHDNGYHRGLFKNHHTYNTRVYKPYPENHRIYKLKPLKEVRKHDDKRDKSKKNTWNSKK
ncbi:MAG: hypothetical protein ACOYM7_09685 [Paludibacter sp.]